VGCEEDGNKGVRDGKISLNEFKAAIKCWIKEGNDFKSNDLKTNDDKENQNHHQHKDHQNHHHDKKHHHHHHEKDHHQKNTLFKSHTIEENHKKLKLDENENNDLKVSLQLKTIDLDEQVLDYFDDEEEEEEHFIELTDKQLVLKAIWLLVIGTIICGIFSEPLVGVIGAVSTKMNISPFYISFVVAPIALNTREIIASFSYARKKTTNSISLLLSSFNGSATMNNTLALAIFLGIIYFRSLPWNFAAEVITLVIVIILVGLNSLPKIIRLWQAFFVGSLYPLSILLVFIMKTYLNLD